MGSAYPNIAVVRRGRVNSIVKSQEHMALRFEIIGRLKSDFGDNEFLIARQLLNDSGFDDRNRNESRLSSPGFLTTESRRKSDRPTWASLSLTSIRFEREVTPLGPPNMLST